MIRISKCASCCLTRLDLEVIHVASCHIMQPSIVARGCSFSIQSLVKLNQRSHEHLYEAKPTANGLRCHRLFTCTLLCSFLPSCTLELLQRDAKPSTVKLLNVSPARQPGA